jgi:hypothetical protein
MAAGDVAAVENRVAKLSVNGRHGGGDAAGGSVGDARPPRRPRMDAELRGDESNEGFLVSYFPLVLAFLLFSFSLIKVFMYVELFYIH